MLAYNLARHLYQTLVRLLFTFQQPILGYSGLRAIIPRRFGCQVSVSKITCLEFGQTSIKSKSVWSCRKHLRVPLKVQCVSYIPVALCYAVSCWSHDFICVVDSLLLNQTWKFVRTCSDPLVYLNEKGSFWL
jgi:hypothetical protein